MRHLFLYLYLYLFLQQSNAQSILGKQGGFEQTTIDNTSTYSSAQTGKWTKDNSNINLSIEQSIVRSGANALKARNTSTTGRRIYSPHIAITTTSRMVIQFYARTSAAGSQEWRLGIARNGTESTQASYSQNTATGTWEKFVYAPTSTTSTNANLWATIFLRLPAGGTAGDVFIDDVCMYIATSADNTPPAPPSDLVATNTATTSIDMSWSAAPGGTDDGGYMVVRYPEAPSAADDPNVNGIYDTGNRLSGTVTGTVVFTGNATSCTDSGLDPGTTYWYKVYTFDKAYNYSSESTGSFSTAPAVIIFRTIASGNFSNISTWEYSTGGTYTNATRTPAPSDNITIGGAHTLTLDQDHTVGASANFLINTGGAMIVEPGKSFTVDGNANFNAQPVIFRSSSTTSVARLAAITGTISGATNVTTERYIPQTRRAYRQLSPGVTTTGSIRGNWQNDGSNSPGIGIHITGSNTGANGFDISASGAPNMFTYTPGNPSYTAIANTSTLTLDALQGYRVFIYGDRNADLTVPNNTGPGTDNIAMNHSTILRATGTIITGDVVYNKDGVTANGITNRNITLGNNAGDFNLLANPYWSPVDFILVERSNIAPTYWLWDPSLGHRGAYVSYNTLTGASGGSVTKDIQPGQAVFVQTTAAVPSITFREQHKSTGTTNTFRTISTTLPKVTIQLVHQQSQPTVLDAATIVIDKSFSNDIKDEDAVKLLNPDENIAVLRNGQMLSTEGLPPNTTDTIPMRIWNLYANNNYAVQFSLTDLPAGMLAILRDKYIQKQFLLGTVGTTTVTLSFNADSASYYDRYDVILKTQAAVPLPVSFINISAKPEGHSVLLQWIVAQELAVKNYTVERSDDGLNFNPIATINPLNNYKQTNTYSFTDNTIIKQKHFYRVRMTGISGDTHLSSTVPAFIISRAGVTIYPNPLDGREFIMRQSSPLRGVLKLFNALGAEVFTAAVDESVVQTFTIPTTLNAGVYWLRITNTGNGYETKVILK